MHNADHDNLTVYPDLVRKRIRCLLLLSVLLLIASLSSLLIGSYHISPPQLLQTLAGSSGDELQRHLVWGIRLPRLVGSLLAGAGLALSGCVMQVLLKNPLAAPSTLGVSQGAAFGAACAIILLQGGQTFHRGEGVLLTSYSLTALCAFGGALVTVAAISLLASIRQISSEAMILAGVAMGAFLNACTMLLQYFASELQVAATLFWTFGDLGKAGWQENMIMALILGAGCCYLLAKAWSYTALLYGDDVARSLGVATARLRMVGLILTCLVVAVTTAFLGIIAFVGLMAPHLVRPWAGTDQRYLLVASALCGALLLLVADSVARLVLAPVIIPVGIITSFAGAPLFIWLLLKRKPL
jgi:iron complex transport system permease protein